MNDPNDDTQIRAAGLPRPQRGVQTTIRYRPCAALLMSGNPEITVLLRLRSEPFAKKLEFDIFFPLSTLLTLLAAQQCVGACHAPHMLLRIKFACELPWLPPSEPQI